jgi:hypothetical protein
MDLFQEDLKRHYEQGLADKEAQAIKIVESGKWVGETLKDDIINLTKLIKGEKNGD